VQKGCDFLDLKEESMGGAANAMPSNHILNKEKSGQSECTASSYSTSRFSLFIST